MKTAAVEDDVVDFLPRANVPRLLLPTISAHGAICSDFIFTEPGNSSRRRRRILMFARHHRRLLARKHASRRNEIENRGRSAVPETFFLIR